MSFRCGRRVDGHAAQDTAGPGRSPPEDRTLNGVVGIAGYVLATSGRR